MSTASKQFDGRAENYARYRPSYPIEVTKTIIATCSLDRGSRVADIGSGTGIFSEAMVNLGLDVFAVEPNAEMRQAAELSLKGAVLFHSISGTAEETTLEDRSVDAVTAAQAFHWFRPEPTKMEIRRILKPGGRIALVWNQRDTKTEFQQDYASLLRKHVPSYDDLAHTRIDDEAITEFLDHRTLEYYCFANRQLLDFDGLLGRMQSSSYTPTAGHPAFGQIADELMELFEMKQDNGRIAFDYETRLFVGRLSNG